MVSLNDFLSKFSFFCNVKHVPIAVVTTIARITFFPKVKCFCRFPLISKNNFLVDFFSITLQWASPLDDSSAQTPAIAWMVEGGYRFESASSPIAKLTLHKSWVKCWVLWPLENVEMDSFFSSNSEIIFCRRVSDRLMCATIIVALEAEWINLAWNAWDY